VALPAFYAVAIDLLMLFLAALHHRPMRKPRAAVEDMAHFARATSPTRQCTPAPANEAIDRRSGSTVAFDEEYLVRQGICRRNR
jgi:hypothetical protein